MPDPVVMGGRPDEVDGPEEWLTPIERERADRFVRDSDRRVFVAAHLLVRHCAAILLDKDPATLTLLQHCDVHGPGHGRPSLEQAPHLGVSFSHTRGYVCAAVGEGRTGIDAEHVPDGPLEQGLVGQALAPRERERVTGNRELIRQWVRKEALIKRGELTLDRLRDTDLSDLPFEGHDRLVWQGRHLLEWATPEGVLVTAITDTPARQAPIP